MPLNLEDHLVFYGSYHQNPVNVAIHMTCVLPILLSGICLATNTGPLFYIPNFLTIPNLEPNLGTLCALVWGGLYVLLEPVAGTALALLCLAATAALNCVRQSNPSTTSQIAVAIHVGCWLLQFLGHAVFEGRSPALFDSLFQAIFLAPLFVWIEALFMLGYRPELKARVGRGVETKVAKLRAGSAQKREERLAD